MKKRKLIFLLPIAAMALGACGNKEEPKDEPGQQEEQDEVTLAIKNKANFELEVGATKQLEAELKGATGTLAWSSSEESVATVDQTGKVTAVAVGTSKISVMYEGHVDSVTVTVKEAETSKYGTVAHPLSVEEAKAILDEECAEADKITKEALVVKGVVKQLIKAYDYTEGPSFEFKLSDGTNEIYVYRALGTEELAANFEVGSEVVVQAFGKNYKGTIEMCDNEDAKSTLIDAKKSTKTISKIEGVTAPQEITAGASLLLDSVNVEISWVEGGTGIVHPDSIDLDTSVAGEVTGTVHVGTFTETFSITVTAPKENKFVEAYDAAIAVGKGNTTASEYYFEGVVVGKRGTEYFVQHDGYGIDVYNPSITPAIGDKLGVTATLQNYSGLVETKSISKVEKLGTETLPEAAKVTSASVLDGLKQNILCEIEGNVKEQPVIQDGKDVSIKLELGSDVITVFIKKTIISSYKSFVESLKAGDTMKLTNAVTSIYNTSKQIIVIDGSSLEKVVHPVTGVTLDKESLTIEAGSAPVTLTETVAPENATNKSVTWESSNTAVATVVDGVVTAVAPGNATITVTTVDGEKTATCALTVTEATRTMTGITVEGPTKVEYTAGEVLDLTGLVVKAVYDSGDPEVITSGYTTSIAAGTALTTEDTSFTVSYGGFTSDPISLTVNAAVPTNYGTLDEPISVTEALAIAAKEATTAGSFTKQAMYIQGTVEETKDTFRSESKGNKYFGKWNIVTGDDSLLVANTMMIEGGVDNHTVYSGDVIVLKGFIKNDSSAGLEVIKGTDNVYPSIEKVVSKAPIKITLEENEHATVTGLPETAEAGSTVTFTVTAKEGYEIVNVKAGATELKENDGSYSFVATAAITVSITTQEAGAQFEAPDKFEMNFEGANETGKASELNSTSALAYLKKALTDSDLGDYIASVEVSKIYNGNSSGGWVQSYDYMKTGTSSANGTLTVTFDSRININSVSMMAHAWTTTSTDTVSVNGSAAQTASTDVSKCGELVFDITGTNVVNITFAKRVFVGSLTFKVAK